MFKWITQLKESSRQTKFFILNWFIYGVAIIATTLYCYGRLNYERTGKTPSSRQIQDASKNPKLGFAHFLDSSSERSFLKLNKFLGKGKNTLSCEINDAAVCSPLEYESKKCTKTS